MESRLQAVEDNVQEVKTNVKVIASAMTDMKDIVKEMGHTVANLVSIDNRTTKNEQDINEIFILCRSLVTDMGKKETHHHNKCEERVDDSETKTDKKLDKYLTWGVAISIFMFGYFYLDLKAHKEESLVVDRAVLAELKKISDTVIVNGSNILHNTDALNKANGHRRYIQKEVKDDK